ncbi:MAG: hypothetical protein M1828_000535 [Chrysothrix sp. TS-e1954]|nr:MAG: hypothetical protein M1828_000535 [Chrysothrix sp. TS-e1954]
MADSQGLTATPLNPQGSFNWQYLLTFIVEGVLTLFFLFYFNRLFATAVAYALRLYTWHRLRIYIDIEALQISLLGGRIFFKGLRYHGENETILVHGGYITWRYWLARIQKCEAFQPDSTTNKESASDNDLRTGRENADSRKQKVLPCRISVKVSGVEAFLYNRSPAYDIIADSIAQRNSSDEAAHVSNEATREAEKTGARPAFQHVDNEATRSTTAQPLRRDKTSSSSSAGESWKEDAPDMPERRVYQPPAFLRLLPIHVECSKAAAVLGNEHTPSVITTRIDSASGTFNAAKSGPLDIFKILIDFDVTKPLIQMKPNLDYKRPQLAEAATLKGTQDAHLIERDARVGQNQQAPTKTRRRRLFWRNNHIQDLARYFNLSSKARQSAESIARYVRTDRHGYRIAADQNAVPGQSGWLGLTRYLEDTQHDEHDEWGAVEYAKTTTLADVDSLNFKFYWDIPGKVPEGSTLGKALLPQAQEDINGTTPPEYGMDLHVRGGHVNYGPWADRHRINLQQMYFPFPFVDAVPSSTLNPGDDRVCTVFKLFLSVDADTILRIPFREPSKDWRWKGRSTASKSKPKSEGVNNRAKSRRKSAKQRRREKGLPNTDLRPFAWFDVKVRSQSTISYTMDMIAGPAGYRNKLSVDVSGIDMFTSLNHALLWRCGRTSMQCDLSNPLAWAGLREWVFDIEINNLDLFLLRDHTFLLVDMIEDWSTGPLPDFMTFIPYRYRLKVNFVDFKMFLNVNDANIVNNSDDVNDNDFVILYGARLPAELMIPLDRFRPVQNEISFDVAAYDLGFELRLPVRNTLNAFVSDKNVAQLQSVSLQGSYDYCSEVRPGQTETLNMTIHGKSLNLNFYGFFARQLAKIKENYFGDDLHFRTLEEYQDLARRNFEGALHSQTSTRSNDLDVILDIIADDINILLPAGLYDSKEFVKGRVENANVDLRVTNYYLELMVNSSPLEMSYRSSQSVGGTLEYHDSNTQIFLDVVKCYGHRLFGLAPTEPAYVSNWDIEAGELIGECSSTFLKILIEAAESLALTITDGENALPLPQLIFLYDSTFVRFACPLINLWIHAGGEALLLRVKGISGAFNDLAGAWFSQVLKMNVSQLSLACLEADATRRHNAGRHESANTLAYIDTALTFDMLERSKDFEKMKKLQQEYMLMHDARYPRATFMCGSQNGSRPAHAILDPVSIPLPSLPSPLRNKYSKNSRGAKPQPPSALKETHTPRTRGVSSMMDDLQSTVAFSSPFKVPHFPLMKLRSDLTNVPTVVEKPDGDDPPQILSDVADLNDLSNEDSTHTSFMVEVKPAIVGYIQPKAVVAVAEMLQILQPKTPAEILDKFQATTIRGVLSAKARSKGTNSVLDIGFHIPLIQVRSHHGNPDSTPVVGADEYNLSSDDVKLAVRIRNVPERKQQDNSISAHVLCRSISLSAQRHTGSNTTNHVALRAVVDDVLLWLVMSDRASIHGAFNLAEVMMASPELGYLASLVHRTTMLIDDFRARFVRILAEQSRRSRYFVYRITEQAGETPDPQFLTRPSYILRTAQDHLRNSESWKVLSQLRHIYCSLDDDVQRKLVQDIVDGDIVMPDNAESYVLATIDQWQSWDACQVRDSQAMQALYGSRVGPQTTLTRTSPPLALGIRGAALKLVMDPGTKQSGVTIKGILLSLAIHPPPPPSAMNLFQEFNEAKATVVQINTTSISLQLAWNVCELVDRILTLFEENTPGQQQVKGPDNAALVQEARSKETFQVVFVSSYASIYLETIHLIQIATTNDLKCSVSGTGWADDLPDFSVNVLIAARAASLEMRRHERLLWRSRVIRPSLWIASEMASKPEVLEQTLRTAGDCDELHFTIEDEVLGLLSVANEVMKDEVVYIQKLSEKHSQLQQSSTPAPKQLKPRSFRLHLAFFLNVYHVKIAVLKDLWYITEGRVIRLAILPESSTSATYQINFDLKAQSHALESSAATLSKVGPKWSLPPINGRLRVQYQQNTTDVSASLIMEKIFLDGSTIYQVLTLVAAPQFAKALDAIKHDGSVVIQTAQSLITQSDPGTSRETHSPKSPKTLVFDSHVVLDGLRILAEAPSAKLLEGKTIVSIVLGNTQIRASNRNPNTDLPLRFPEAQVALGQLSIRVEKAKGDRILSHGSAKFGAIFTCAVKPVSATATKRDFKLSARGPDIRIYPATGPAIVHIIGHFRTKFLGLDLSREKRYFQRLRHSENLPIHRSAGKTDSKGGESHAHSFVSSFAFDLQASEIRYFLQDPSQNMGPQSSEHLAFTLGAMDLLTRGEKEARLSIEETRLALRPSLDRSHGSKSNFALLPELLFDVTHQRIGGSRRLTFRAAGKALEIVLEPHFMVPISRLEKSLSDSSAEARVAIDNRHSTLSATNLPKRNILEKVDLSSLLVHASFAGAIIRLQEDNAVTPSAHVSSHAATAGTNAEMHAPGIAMKLNFERRKATDPVLNVEVRVEASSNTLSPGVVPLILQISDSVKEVVKDVETRESQRSVDEKRGPDLNVESTLHQTDLVQTDPRAILGKTRLNVGFQICSQEFSLSCQPIAKITASMKLEDSYITVSNIDTPDNGNFFAASIAFRRLTASLQHMYSRDSTLSFEVESVILSIMNNKHVSGKSGISTMLKINPAQAQINAKQLQDILLFREIWYPQELRGSQVAATAAAQSENSQDYFMRRYQQISEATQFPWNASVVVADLKMDLDLGQAIGRLSFGISNLWASSKKTSGSQQSLCIGVDEMSVDSTGRMSGYVHLDRVKIRTSIAWLAAVSQASQTPLIQGSIGFDRIQVKAAFDYQTFAVADITLFEFIMYNVRDNESRRNDRLVAILDGERVNVYVTALAAALGVSLAQTFERLIQDKKASFDQALKDVDKFLQRKRRTSHMMDLETQSRLTSPQANESTKMPISLHTDVVVTLGSLNVGAFPRTLLDTQILRLEASSTQARFAVTLEEGVIHSGLGLTLGQVSAALATVPQSSVPKSLGEISIEQIVNNAMSSRGGIILRVPRVVAAMQTWQPHDSRTIDYIFRSSFEGKIDVGWNYSRISYIRGMWATHSRTLAGRLGKPLPESALKITAPKAPSESDAEGDMSDETGDKDTTANGDDAKVSSTDHKITAVVNLPQSKYNYRALEPPIIETPQLRDMGEATPPLEWIGLQREKLPNITHQIVIVTLLEVAKEVEDAYSRILGTA